MYVVVPVKAMHEHGMLGQNKNALQKSEWSARNSIRNFQQDEPLPAAEFLFVLAIENRVMNKQNKTAVRDNSSKHCEIGKQTLQSGVKNIMAFEKVKEN